jgi:cytochrome c553
MRSRAGVRLNAVMSPIAKTLSESDISDVTAYWRCSPKSSKIDCGGREAG